MNRFWNHKIISIALIVAIAVGAVVVYLNQGFHYTYYRPTFVISIDAENPEDVLNEYALAANVSEVNRQAAEISLQFASNTQVESMIAEISARDDVASASYQLETYVLPHPMTSRLVIGIVSTIFAIFAIYYYLFARKFARKNFRTTYLTAFFIGLAAYSGIFLHLVLLSIISRLYTLGELSFTGVLISFFWLVMVGFVSLRKILPSDSVTLPSLRELLNDFHLELKKMLPVAVSLWVVALGGVSLGLGTKFVVEGLVLASALLIAHVALTVLPQFYYTVFAAAITGKPRAPKVTKKAATKRPASKKVEATEKSKTARKPSKTKRRNRR